MRWPQPAQHGLFARADRKFLHDPERPERIGAHEDHPAQRRLTPVGTYESAEDRTQNRAVLVEANGIRIAVVAISQKA